MADRRVMLMAALLLLSVVALGVAKASAVTPPPVIDPTTTTVSSSSSSMSPGSTVTLTAYVSDTAASPSAPTGVVTWSDDGAGGSFSVTTCNLSPVGTIESDCSLSYTEVSPAGTNVTIVGTYAGEATHYSSAGQLSIPVFSPSSTVVSPGSLSVITGAAINFTATVTDDSIAQGTVPRGGVTWSDGSAGGSFSAAQCTLAQLTGTSSKCTVTYTVSSQIMTALSVSISADYQGDGVHSPSSGSASLSILPASIPMTVSFEIVGSSKGAATPTFTYLLNNVTHTVQLTDAPTSYKVDINSNWFVPNELGNSSATVAWNLFGASRGVASYQSGNPTGGVSMTFVYYHQYLVTLGYQVVGGTAGASIPPLVKFTSFGVTQTAAPPGQTWADVGTTYAYPALIPGSLGDVRWLAQNVTGVITGPGDFTPTYYHQFSLSVAYVVKDSPGKQTPPTFYWQSMGTQFNGSAASLTSNLWLDAGSKYSFTDPLAGANSTVRWSAGGAASGVVTSTDIDVTYYEQYALTASFKTTDGSAPSVVKEGVPTPVLPSLSGLSGNSSVSIPLTTLAQAVWLDSGSPYSIPSALLAESGQKWVATGPVNGTVTMGASVSQTYYHEYLVNVSYSQAGAPSSPPSLTYTILGNQMHSPLTPQGSTFWIDAGTQFSVPDSSVGDRWYAPSAPSGVASSNMTVTYYHQYLVDVSLKIEGGSQPAQVSFSGVSGGQKITELLSTESQPIWLDSGTSYSIPQALLVLTNERWVATASLSGTISSPTAVTQEFYHQVLLNVSSSGAPSGQKPLISYVSFGANTIGTLAPTVSSVWADAGTTFSVQSIINGTVNERWFSAFPALNLTAPFQATVQYFHQYLMTYTFSASGETLTVPATMTVVADGKNASMTISSEGGDFWLDSGSNWQVTLPASAQGQSGTRWESGGPTQGTITGPTTVHLSYFVQFLVVTAASPAKGGTVTSGNWYNASSSITLRAVPNEGWTLGGWSGLGTSAFTGTNATASVSVLSPMNETALFEPSLTIISSTGGSVKYTTGTSLQDVGGGQSVQTYVQGNGSVTLQAHAAFPYQFVKWSGVDSANSTRLTLNLTAPTQIEAVFSPSYMDIIGIPAVVFVSGLTAFLARRPILASGRNLIRSLKEALSG